MLCLVCFQQCIAATFFSKKMKPFSSAATFFSPLHFKFHCVVVQAHYCYDFGGKCNSLLPCSLNSSPVKLCIWQPFLQNINGKSETGQETPACINLWYCLKIVNPMSFYSIRFPLNRTEFYFIFFPPHLCHYHSVVCRALCSGHCCFLCSSLWSSFPMYMFSSCLMCVGLLFLA